MPFKSSNLKDKATNTDSSCFDVEVSEHKFELSTSDEDVADNDTLFHRSQCSNEDAHTTESEFTIDCVEFETKPNNLSGFHYPLNSLMDSLSVHVGTVKNSLHRDYKEWKIVSTTLKTNRRK